MASHAPQTILFATNNGSVMTSGYSGRLGKGQFGIVDKGAAPSALGLAVVNTFPTTPKDRLFELRLGAADLAVTRSQSNKTWSSVPFKLSEVVDISVSSPKVDVSVDDFIIGYDGVNDSSAIVLANGDNEVINIKLHGEAIGMLGYANSEVVVKLHLEAPNTGSFTMHEIIEKAVARLKEVKLVGGVPITEYIDILPVNSSVSVFPGGLNQQFYSLTVKDNGNYTDLGLVQAQYPAYVVKRKEFIEGYSTYVLIAAEGATLADYVQTNITITDADCDGEPETSSATIETAWVAGDVCTAISKNFTIQLADTKCGENRLAELQAMYPNLTILVDTPTQEQELTLTGTSGTANVTVNGVDYLAKFASDLTTTASNFVTEHGASLLALGVIVRANAGVLTFSAASTAFPTISIANATTNLAGTLGVLTGTGTATAQACQTVYRTTVYSDLVCEECDPIFTDLFVAEAPARFEFVDWVAETPVYDADAKMGIRIRGKFNIMAGSEEYRDEIPFIYTSTRIAIANEAPGMVNESFNIGTNGRFAVKLLDIATEPEGLGKDLRDLEERTRVYFTNQQRHHGNNYGKLVLGEESLLKALVPYKVYSVRVRTNRFAQSFSGELVENFHYMIAVEVGKEAGIETVINALATAAGLPTV